MKNFILILLLAAGVFAALYHFKDLTPSERAHCLATSTDKTICE